MAAAFATASALVCAAEATQAPAPPGTPAANKQLVIDFFAFQGGRQERADRFMADDYVQHNPRFLKMDTFTGAHGRQAWVAAGQEAQRRGNLQLVALGGIPLRDPIILTAEGDLGFAVYRGQLPDPDRPGQRYEAFAFEAFRFRDGKFTEHWDQVKLAKGWMEPRPPAQAGNRGTAPAGNRAPLAPPPEPRPGCTASPASIAANKQLVASFSLARRRGFTRELVIAECEFVSVVWKRSLPDPDEPLREWDAFAFDTFRIRDGQLVEHWDESTR
jgi:predicted SnoaL-like aldol condensation-catalyzing enzyme